MSFYSVLFALINENKNEILSSIKVSGKIDFIPLSVQSYFLGDVLLLLRVWLEPI